MPDQFIRSDHEQYEALMSLLERQGGSEVTTKQGVYLVVQDNDEIYFVLKGSPATLDSHYSDNSFGG